ncbi:MAG: ankyrin repeat domain-containing protein [Bdellovibrionota bacterium]
MRTITDYKKLILLEDPILEYARRGSLEGVKSYVNIMNLDLKDDKGYSPLMWAAHNGHYEVVKLLLSLEADVQSRDNNGNSILMAAVFKGHLQVVQLLLEHGADPDACNYKKQTALVFARTFGLRAIERILARAS